jgi:hypothetical protein
MPVGAAFAIRNILLFRDSLLRTLGNEGNNDYYESLWKTRILTNPSAHFHTTEPMRRGLLIKARDGYHSSIEESKGALLSMIVQTVVDERIGCMNMELLDSSDSTRELLRKETVRHQACSEFDDDLRVYLSILQGKHRISTAPKSYRFVDKTWEHEISVDELITHLSDTYRFRTNACGQSYQKDVWHTFLLRAVLDAIMYSCRPEAEPARIKVSDVVDKSGTFSWLTIENIMHQEKAALVLENRADPQMRGDGVSIPVMYQALNLLYDGWPEAHCIIDVLPVNEYCIYTLSLPVLSRRDTREDCL